jgi:hypothetical protein
MTDFDLSASAECDICGAYLASSHEECDHNGQPVETHVFRRVGEGRESLVGVETVIRQKWNALEEAVGDDWIAYQWLGTQKTINTMLNGPSWESVEDLPSREMSATASKD